MIITRELIFDRIGETLQEKLESTFKWSSCEEYFNPDGTLVSKNTSVKWPSRLRTLHLLKRKVVMALWNIMTAEKINVKGKTRWEVAYEITGIFISPKFIKNKFKCQIEMDEAGEMTESINPMAPKPVQTEESGDFMDFEYSDDYEEFGDDRRYGQETDDSEDEDICGIRDDFYNPDVDDEMDSDEEYDGQSKKKDRQTAKRKSSKMFEWVPPPSDPAAIVQPELLKHMTNGTKDESKIDLQRLLSFIPASYQRL